MGQLATDIHNEAVAQIPAAPVSDPAELMTGPQLLQIFAKVEAAIAALELLTRGARIVRVAGVPGNAAGENGDLGLNTLTTDLYAKDGGAWQFIAKLKGDKGDNIKGDTGLSAYQLAQQQGFVGGLDQWLASLGRAGNDGKSAFEVAKAAGFPGSVAQWLAALKGEPGEAGADAELLPNSVTNDVLGADVKVGSVSAAGNAYPAVDRAGLTTVEKFLVWIGPKVTDLFTRVGQLDTGFGTLAQLVNGFNGRLTAVENRPAGGTGAAYSLPAATATQLGGVKVGAGLAVAVDGTLSATATGTGSSPAYSLPVATAAQLGGVKAGAGVQIAGDGTLSVPFAVGLKFDFGTGAASVSGTVSSDEAGAYAAFEGTNLASYQVTKNGTAVGLPLAFVVGDAYRIDIVRAAGNQVAILKLKP